MSKITRAKQKIFGNALTALNNIAQFGSLKASSPSYSLDPAVIQQLSNFDNGWAGAVVNNAAPALQDLNAMDYLTTYQLAYLMQAGVAEYDSTTAYYIGSIVSDSLGGLFISVTDNNVGNLLSDTANWKVYVSNKIVSTSANLTVAYDTAAVVCTGSSAVALTIPQAVSGNAGRMISIKSLLTGGAAVTVSATGGSLIDGLSSLVLYQNASAVLLCTGSAWIIMSNTGVSGTYTPTVVTKTGVLSGGVVTPSVAQFSRSGSVVTVSGEIMMQATGGGDGAFTMSLPFASSFSAVGQAGGAIVSDEGTPTSTGYGIKSVVSTSNVKLAANHGTTSLVAWYYSFTYQIV